MTSLAATNARIANHAVEFAVLAQPFRASKAFLKGTIFADISLAVNTCIHASTVHGMTRVAAYFLHALPDRTAGFSKIVTSQTIATNEFVAGATNLSIGFPRGVIVKALATDSLVAASAR